MLVLGCPTLGSVLCVQVPCLFLGTGRGAGPEADKERAWDDEENTGPVLQVGIRVWAARLAFTLQPRCPQEGQPRGCADSLHRSLALGEGWVRLMGNSQSLLGH